LGGREPDTSIKNMTGPVLLIVLGVLFLLNNLIPGFRFSRLWPVILIVIGLSKIIEYFQTKDRGGQSSTPRKEGE
jgi:uncharacterized membrane protein HdeD (DUF308 family)